MKIKKQIFKAPNQYYTERKLHIISESMWQDKLLSCYLTDWIFSATTLSYHKQLYELHPFITINHSTIQICLAKINVAYAHYHIEAYNIKSADISYSFRT